MISWFDWGKKEEEEETLEPDCGFDLEKKPLGFLTSLIWTLEEGAIGRFFGEDFGELVFLLVVWVSIGLLVVVVLMVVTGIEENEEMKEEGKDRGGRRSWERERGADCLRSEDDSHCENPLQ